MKESKSIEDQYLPEERKKEHASIEYPYLPEGRKIEYVSVDNEFMAAAKKFADDFSLDKNFPTASILVKSGEIVSMAANGSEYHKSHGCERVKQGIPTGQGYDLCEGCHPKNHSENKAIVSAISEGKEIIEADLYLWGHWWCCEACWKSMIDAGVRHVYLMEGSEKLFNNKRAGNIETK